MGWQVAEIAVQVGYGPQNNERICMRKSVEKKIQRANAVNWAVVGFGVGLVLACVVVTLNVESHL